MIMSVCIVIAVALHLVDFSSWWIKKIGFVHVESFSMILSSTYMRFPGMHVVKCPLAVIYTTEDRSAHLSIVVCDDMRTETLNSFEITPTAGWYGTSGSHTARLWWVQATLDHQLNKNNISTSSWASKFVILMKEISNCASIILMLSPTSGAEH